MNITPGRVIAGIIGVVGLLATLIILPQIFTNVFVFIIELAFMI